ncbi:MAG: hypothetical protein M1838_000668 [Thelocarpon superellum]|nr:MAG: hypothetical protein M1838_000668 [Thelocarpon superellum]
MAPLRHLASASAGLRRCYAARTKPAWTVAQRATTSPQRGIHATSTVRWPRKDSQDKDSINTEATEYSKSSTDDQAAREGDAAFDPNRTDPQEELEKAGEGHGSDGNPLEVSPANPDVSKPREGTEGGAETSQRTRDNASGGGSAPKNEQQ